VIIVLAAVALWGLATRNLIAAVPADVVIWAAWVYLNPFTKCGWCKGTGKHPLSGKRFFGSCWNPRCQRGTVQRLGSKTVHRAVRALADYRKNRKDKE
jgi:hypothetical protein